MAAKKKSTEVATQQEAQLPAGMSLEDLQADAEQYNPQLTPDDVGLPYISILQNNSPQCTRGGPKYIDGAQSSMFHNNITNEVFEGMEEGFIFVPCHYERKYVEWVDRDKGGGIVQDYNISSDIMSKTTLDDKNKARLPNGNIVVETAYHYGLMLNPLTDTWEQCVIAMKSTMLKKNRAFNNELTKMKIPGTDVTAPRWFFPWNFRTVLETKNDNSWFNFHIEKGPEPVFAELYAQAKMFAELIAAGAVKRGSEEAATTAPDDEVPY